MKIFFDGQLEGLFCPKRGNYDEDYDDESGEYNPEEDLIMMFPDEDDRAALYE